METKICDICENHEKYCKFNLIKKWKFFAYEWAMGDIEIYKKKLDICDDCFKMIQDFSKNKELMFLYENKDLIPDFLEFIKNKHLKSDKKEDIVVEETIKKETVNLSLDLD